VQTKQVHRIDGIALPPVVLPNEDRQLLRKLDVALIEGTKIPEPNILEIHSALGNAATCVKS
jgi:hypothetical protein